MLKKNYKKAKQKFKESKLKGKKLLTIKNKK